MFDKDAIKELSQAQAITAANEALGDMSDSAVVVHNDFTVQDLEKYMGHRRRARGGMVTSVAEHFAAYANTHSENGAAVFVDPDNMAATAVLNLGTPEFPGHADNTATLKLRRTAPFTALLSRANGQPMKQTDAAEFIEDWAPYIHCADSDGATVEAKHAASALRKITIEAMKRVENSEQQLGASRSAFESVQASSAEKIPTLIAFRCEPYQGLAARVFQLRLSVLATDKPMLVLRPIAMEKHAEEMAAELAALVSLTVGEAMPVHIGTYQATR